MEIISIFITFFVVLILTTLLYFYIVGHITSYYSKNGVKQKMWSIYLGLIILFAILLCIMGFYDSQLKQSFIAQHIWIYPMIIIICVISIIGLKYYIERMLELRD